MNKLVIGAIIAIIIIGGIGAAIATDVIEFNENNKEKKVGGEKKESVMAVISANRTKVRVNENITFDASGSKGNITSYIWDFGDNSPKANNVTVVHSYSNGGRYLINLTVLGSRGATDSTSIYIGVTYHQQENGTIYAYPFMPDTINATVPIKNGSRNMKINLTLDPNPGQSVDLDITIYDSNGTAIYNASHEGVTQKETFFHTISDFKIYGNYNIELHCRQGSTDYEMGIDVNYNDY